MKNHLLSICKLLLFTTTFLLAMIMATLFITNYSTVSANTINTTQKNIDSPKKINKSGLMGYYYLDNNFSHISFFTPTQENGLKYNKNKVDRLVKDDHQVYKGIEWIGYYKPSTTKKYKLSLSNSEIDNNSTIILDGTTISDKGQQKKSINLKKNKEIPIKIIYASNDGVTYDDLKNLHIVADVGNNEQPILNKNLRDFSNSNKIIKNASNTLTKRDNDDSLDTDGDSIPDVMELNGYTISDEVAVPWTDSLGGEYTKYTSNPFNSHTAGDPYTDFEKASEQIDKATDPCAFNPLVAAEPSVTVSLENLILSPNTNYSNSVSSSQSSGWSSSNTIGASVTAEASLLPSLNVTTDYSHTDTTTNDWGKTQGSDSSINSASAGYLNANARYYNTGTGAIYNVKPTTNFVLGNNTIATIKAQDNTTALAMGAGECYPQIGQHGVALNTMDNFSSSPITLNYQQLNNLLNNQQSLSIETTQTDGTYMTYDDNGNLVAGSPWSGYEEQIRNMTADFIIDTGKTVTERKVAARNFDNPDDKTPILNVKQALSIAYPDGTFTEKNGELSGSTPTLYFNNQPINEESFIGSMDAKTQTMIYNQINSDAPEFKNIKSVFDVKLMPKMNITFKLPEYYNIASDDNADPGITTKSGIWSETGIQKDSSTAGSYCYVGKGDESTYVLPSSISNILQKSDDSGYGTYMVSLYVKRDSKDDSSKNPDIYLRSLNSNSVLLKKSVDINHDYQRVDLLVYNGTNSDFLSSIHIVPNGSTVDWNSLSINKISGLNLTNN